MRITLQKIDTLISKPKWAIGILLICGLISASLSLLAYAPADGADGLDYYLHAAFLAGEEVPAAFALHSPLLPLLILFFHYGLGMIYSLIALQFVFSIVQAVLFYWALRDYDPRFAFLTALLICFDMQVKVLNSFVSTEPIYILLASLAFALLMRQIRRENRSWKEPQDWLLAFILALLFFTRSVGRYLILPFALLFFVFTRRWKRSLVLILVYFVSLQGLNFAYEAFFRINPEEVSGVNNEVLFAVPLFRGDLLNANNGTASAELSALASQCTEEIPVRCIMEIQGRAETLRLVNRALVETALNNPLDYGWGVFQQFSMFLSLSGQQYQQDSPAQAQCEDVPARAERNFQSLVETDWLLSANPDVDLAGFQASIAGVTGLMCPPLVENTQVRGVVDTLAQAYNLMALPRAYLCYGLLLLAALFFRFMRPYLALVTSAMLLLFYHAAISAVIFNVQARYVVVTNPYRLMLLVSLVYLLVLGIKQAMGMLRTKKSLD